MKLFKLLFILVFFWLNQSLAQTSLYKNYTTENGLPSNTINIILQDPIGYLWFATDKGISKFDGTFFINYTEENGLQSNKVNDLAIKNDSLFIATDYGLSIKIRDTFYNVESKKINTITIAKNETYLGTNQGVYLLKENYLSPLKLNFQIDLTTINDLLFDGNKYWIATTKALWKVDNLRNPKSIIKIVDGNITSILLDKKSILVSTLINGVKHIHFDKVSTITSLKNTISISKIDNEYWISTKDNGIEILNSDLSFSRKINKYNSLNTNNVKSSFIDNTNTIWLATANEGVYQIKDTKTVLEKKPLLQFENIQVAYQSLDSISINNYTRELELLPKQNHVSFTFKTVVINQPNLVKYRYKLNESFSPWSTTNTIDFANLQSGNYTFTVQSKIKQNISKPISFRFFIDKHLHQKLWFQAVIFSSILLLLLLLLWNYTKKLKAKNKAKVEKLELENHLLTLEQKALQLQMNPHFIFNVLNGIKALGNSNNTTELNATISKFASLLRSILNNSRKQEVSLAEEINTLKNYLDLEQQMSSKSFTYQINTELSIDVEEVLIPPMLLQPFIENSIKHGIKAVKDGEITIRFSEKDDFLICAIDDNGIGFKQSQKGKKQSHKSVAIKVTQERIESLSLKSKFLISELKENNTIIGTRVWFKIPLKTDF